MIQFDQQSGFVAGTLVHTDKGLVPIDQIKVGDMVLSRRESDPNAQNEYKRVMNTFKSKETTIIYYFSYEMPDPEDIQGERCIFCAEDHCFWINEYLDNDENGDPLFRRISWYPAKRVDVAEEVHVLETHNNHLAFFNQILEDNDRQLFGFSEEEQIAVARIRDNGSGPLFDFRNGRPISIGGGGVCMKSCSDVQYLARTEENILYPATDEHPDVQFYLSLTKKYDRYQDYVYNIEIEDSHTYFVSKAGIWVHDASANIS